MSEKNNKILNPWWKGFLTSILGTTISIALTFGTSAWMNASKKRAAQRQTAMMVIHDIDVSVDILEKMAEKEEKQMQAVQYIQTHFNQIDSLPGDTLWLAMRMLFSYNSDGVVFDDSKEKIFNSSQDTWNNLDNVSFVDNMEGFYRSRSFVQTMLANSPQWKKPISEAEYFELALHSSNTDHSLNPSAVLKEKFSDPHVRYYIDYASNRVRDLRKYASNWKDLSERNKFIMNISDEDIADYIRKSKISGVPASKSDLVGRWECDWNGTDVRYYDFRQDGSLDVKILGYYSNPFYSGNAVVTLRYGGKWKVKEDSLVMEYDPKTVEAKFDRKEVTYREEMRDSVESFFSKYFNEKEMTEYLHKQFEEPENRKDTYAVSTNKAHNKIEMRTGSFDALGKETGQSLYLKKTE